MSKYVALLAFASVACAPLTPPGRDAGNRGAVSSAEEARAPVQEEEAAEPLVLSPADTALLVTDPQNDFLSPEGVTWGVVGESVTEIGTVENLAVLLEAAAKNGFPVFVSPHYYYPHDHLWRFEGKLEALMHEIGMFDRRHPLELDGFEGSGADWLDALCPWIEDGRTVVTSPHKVYGPETNDLVLQLRKRGIDRVVLGGMSANLCVEAHLRELLEQGFEVVVVSDATAGARTPMGDGYEAAMINFRYMANAVVDAETAAAAFSAAAR